MKTLKPLLIFIFLAFHLTSNVFASLSWLKYSPSIFLGTVTGKEILQSLECNSAPRPPRLRGIRKATLLCSIFTPAIIAEMSFLIACSNNLMMTHSIDRSCPDLPGYCSENALGEDVILTGCTNSSGSLLPFEENTIHGTFLELTNFISGNDLYGAFSICPPGTSAWDSANIASDNVVPFANASNLKLAHLNTCGHFLSNGSFIIDPFFAYHLKNFPGCIQTAENLVYSLAWSNDIGRTISAFSLLATGTLAFLLFLDYRIIDRKIPLQVQNDQRQALLDSQPPSGVPPAGEAPSSRVNEISILISNSTCPVCICELESGTNYSIIIEGCICKYLTRFHPSCLNQITKSPQNRCPICRGGNQSMNIKKILTL